MADFRDLDRLLQKYVDDGLPNASCVIARKGEILYENYFGWADKENGIRLEAKHVFRQASLTKIAMYATAMMLYEQGKFLMTDPLYEYFPEYRNSTKLVTMPNGSLEVVPTEGPILVKHIFNMTCGLPYEMIVGGVPVQHHPTALAMAREGQRVMIAVLDLLLKEGFLVDICLIYAMISFLAVTLLAKVYMGVYAERKKNEEKKEGEKE